MHLRLSIKKPKDVIYRTGGRAIYRSVRSTRVDEPLGYLSKIGAASRQREMAVIAQHRTGRVLDPEFEFMSDVESCVADEHRRLMRMLMHKVTNNFASLCSVLRIR